MRRRRVKEPLHEDDDIQAIDAALVSMSALLNPALDASMARVPSHRAEAELTHSRLTDAEQYEKTSRRALATLPELSELSATGLLRLHAAVSAELLRRGICRSGNNPVADYAEGLVAQALGLKLAGKSTAGYDAKDADGVRYEIKARRLINPETATMLSAIRSIDTHHFDFLVAVIFNADYSVYKAIRLPYESVCNIAKFRKHDNAHIVMIRSLWDAEGGYDITSLLLECVRSEVLPTRADE